MTGYEDSWKLCKEAADETLQNIALPDSFQQEVTYLDRFPFHISFVDDKLHRVAEELS